MVNPLSTDFGASTIAPDDFFDGKNLTALKGTLENFAVLRVGISHDRLRASVGDNSGFRAVDANGSCPFSTPIADVEALCIARRKPTGSYVG